MEPGIIALICAASFGVVVTIVAFVRQLLMSRDKKLNDEAQKRALSQEVSELKAMREQMLENGRSALDYRIFGENKLAIENLDKEIDGIFKEKMDLIKRYAELSARESEAIVDGQFSKEGKEACDKLKLAIDIQIKECNERITLIQARRKQLWGTYVDLQKHILEQEKSRSQHLDALYKQHSSLLEKVFIRHIDNTESVATQGIQAATSTFHSMVMAPIQFLMQYFGISSGINLTQVHVEQQTRDDVEQAQQDVNEKASEEVNETPKAVVEEETKPALV